ncbi:MAG TPA: aminopeptidase [Acidobacteriota bacterium]|nr:aminopeptidase [Acidobacteriota bacterium]
MSDKSQLLSASMIALRDCMGAKPGEKALIVTDEALRPIAHSLWEAARQLNLDVLMIEMVPRKTNGEEPPSTVAALMKEFHLVLCPTSKSLTHTEARRAASASGARIATLPGVSEEIMIRCMNADYLAIARRTHALCELMKQTRIVRVTAPAGTDIVLPISGRTPHASSGLFRERGQWGNLPTGEAYLAPLEEQSSGVVVVDGSMAGIGKVQTPIKITVENGYASDISGGEEADRLLELLAPHGRPARNVAEFGIGTNDKAILSGNILEDEKVQGTIHIAFGDNKSMGGSVQVPSHLDGLIKQPTVWFDEQKVMENGRLLITV